MTGSTNDIQPILLQQGYFPRTKSHIPVEIMAEIFSLVVADDLPSSPPPLYSKYNGVLIVSDRCTGSPLVLAKISRSWRSIAMDTPILWRRICITQITKDLQCAVEVWLRRSGNRPLHLAVCDHTQQSEAGETSASALLDNILRHLSRWENVTFDVRPWVIDMILLKLSQQSTIVFCNNLKSATWKWMVPGKTESRNVQQFLNFLLGQPVSGSGTTVHHSVLDSLTCSGVPIGGHFFAALEKAAPRLRYLGIDLKHTQSLNNPASLPSVQEFTVYTQRPRQLVIFLPMVKGSFPNVKDLRIHQWSNMLANDPSYGPSLQNFLEGCKRLTKLTFSGYVQQAHLYNVLQESTDLRGRLQNVAVQSENIITEELVTFLFRYVPQLTKLELGLCNILVLKRVSDELATRFLSGCFCCAVIHGESKIEMGTFHEALKAQLPDYSHELSENTLRVERQW